MNEREAEDKALESFGQTPFDTEAVVKPLWPIQQTAFRAGFRAGLEHAKTDKTEFRRGWDAAKEESRMLAERSAPNLALENMHEGQPEKTTLWEREGSPSIPMRINALEEWRKVCATAVVPWPADVLARIEDHERRLQTLFLRHGLSST